MKSIIAVCLLISAAFAQETAQPVQTESHAPSLTVSFTGQQEGFYQFKIANTFSHAVTAFALSAVPSGIEKGPSGFTCGNRCSGIFALGDVARPEIKAGASVTQRFAISRVNGGAVVLNAAVFDDESYEGEETAAAQLVARQIGRQAEYDRIAGAINFVFITNGNDSDARKTTLIRMKLGGLSTNLDAKMVHIFKLWFPDLAGCAQQYAQLMKSAAASEKQQVLESMEQFAHGNSPGNASLSQWWQTTQEVLASAGCNGCGDQAMNPKRHSPEQNVSAKCQARPAVVFTASLGDDGTDSGTEEEAAEVDLGPEDVALLDEGAPTQASVSEPVAESPEAEAAKAEPPAMPVSRKIRSNMPPSGIPFIPAPDGRGQLLRRMRFGAVPDDLIYRAFFRDIVTLGDMAFQEEVRWIDGEQVEGNGPRAGGLGKVEIAILKKAAYECNEEANELKAKSDDLLKSSVSGYPVGWLLYAPPIPGMHELKDQETATINKCIVRLRSNLGSSFVRLQGFVNKIYVTSQVQIESVRLSDDALYSNYLRYLATLNDLAEANPRAKKEAALRQQELTKAGLEERDRTLVTQTALEFNKAVAALFEIPKGEIAIFDRRLSGGVRAIGAPSPAVLVQTAAMPPSPAMSGIQAPTAAMPAAAMPESQDARTKELRRKADEAKLCLLTGIAQLQAGMSAPVYKKFDAYLHQLYADAMIRRVANFRGEAASKAVSKSEQE
jgi:hypothetical protein